MSIAVAGPNAAESVLQDGDVVFTRIRSFLYRKVAETSLSWESHVGIAFRATGGGWEVLESAVPLSKRTPFAAFVARSEAGRFEVRRLRNGLSAEQQRGLLEAAERRLGIWYHLGFNYDSRRYYCSKFVYEVFREAIGVEIGRIETFGDLLRANPNAPLWFWRLWFFGRIPWNRRVVTTTSQLLSEQMVTVATGGDGAASGAELDSAAETCGGGL